MQTKHFDNPLTQASFCHGELNLCKGAYICKFFFTILSMHVKKKLGHVNSD